MNNLLDQFLANHGINRYQVAQRTKTRDSSWQNITKYNTDRYSARYIKMLGKVLDMTPGQVLDELVEMEEQNNGDNE